MLLVSFLSYLSLSLLLSSLEQIDPYQIHLLVLALTMDALHPYFPSAPHLPGFLSGKQYKEYPTYWEQLEGLLSPALAMVKMAPLLYTLNNIRGKWNFC